MRISRGTPSSRTGMKSLTRTAPSAVSKSVSRISVSLRYRRERACVGAAGPICQTPWSSSPSNAAKQAGESTFGRQSQSIEPSLPTSALVRRSPINA
jgi:hypothetical protein